MSFAYVHISDIHFGQEKGGAVIVHNDVKERLLDDVTTVLDRLPRRNAAGIVVTGDIAYGGKKDEYRVAAEWLDHLATAAKCAITDIQVVPGNHDIDRAEISRAANWMLSEIASKGEATLDTFLANDLDRQLLYARFASYIPFAEGYNCPLDCHGGLASERVIELAPSRSLQFIGLNSALVCKHKDQRGQLLLGARQRVLPISAGRELVVLCHHPLDWLQDSADARLFVRNRARIFISGHEHKPAVRVETVDGGADLLTLEAGATVPPAAQDPFTYTYNVLEFEWDARDDKLQVTVHPRAWDDTRKRFDDDPVRLGGREPVFRLGCPNYRRAAGRRDGARPETIPDAPLAAAVDATNSANDAGGGPVTVPPGYALTLLRFFRDLSDAQRVAVLVTMNALPPTWSEASSHALERRVLDSLVVSGRLEELKRTIDEQRRITAGG